jgi:hypothetical protein
MPNIDDIQLIAAVRKLPGYSFTPILMITPSQRRKRKMPDAKLVRLAGLSNRSARIKLIAVVRKLVK